jgi:hypothetical protein
MCGAPTERASDDILKVSPGLSEWAKVTSLRLLFLRLCKDHVRHLKSGRERERKVKYEKTAERG